MALVEKNDIKQIFADQAPSIDKPASFANYPRGWDTARPNNGKPTIKQFNYLQQRTDQNILWMHQNGASLPYDETMEYAEGAPVVKEGKLQQKQGDSWVNIGGASTAAELMDESGNTQQEINDAARLYVQSLQDLKDHRTGSLSHITIKDKNATYQWNASSTATIDNYFVVDSNKTSSGRWMLVGDRTTSVSKFLGSNLLNAQATLNTLNFSNRKLTFDQDISISDTLNITADNARFEGNTTNTVLYSGSAGSSGSLKTIVANRKNSNAAITRQQIKNISINMGQKDYCIGFDSYYLTSESLIERVSVNNIAENSVGFKISKCWYTKYRQCFASGYNPSVSGRFGTGVLLESLQADGAQVNAVSMDFRCHTLNIGIHIKPVGYIYGLNMLDMPTIENCNIGIKYDPQTSTNDFQVRQSVISAYFENNSKDIVWGNPDTVGSRASKHTWLNCSFDDVHSTIELYEGHHIFIGCKGIRNLHIGDGAKARFINSPRPVTVTGTTTNLIAEQDPLVFVTAGSYQSIYTRPQGALKLKATVTSGSTATFDLSAAFNTSIASEGQTGLLRIISRRSYDTTPSVLTAILLRKTGGSTLTLTNTPVSTLTATIDGTTLTVSDTRSDSRFIDVVFNPD